MPVPSSILELTDRFERNREEYRSGHYNETQVRRDFIDPLFKALGWDMDNSLGYAEAYRDVIHEDALKIGGTTKAPDYCFRIGGTRKFFLEAKKPAVPVESDAAAAYQVRRYAWTAKLPLSILTNFEEFAIYDCRIKPGPADKAGTARVLYLTYKDYLARWDEIAGIFSLDAVKKGAFDKFAEASKSRKGTATVDEEFLKEIEAWREELARSIALRNPEITQRELNAAVQLTIDRLVFLRIAEDRGIEPYGQLQALLNGGNTYQRLMPIWRIADQKYNSGLFHFTDEREQATQPDKLTPGLEIDDQALKGILSRLYYPESPYEFSVLPAEILGQVYERFLGSVIRLTAGHQAKVEPKPEVRKAGGVFYTPGYIVDYIVKNTVGKLVEGRTPKEIASLRLLDPACGSGSFLLGAYQFLLEWYRDYYVNHGGQAEKRLIHEAHGGEWRLTTAERKRLLLTHIYGVDIDAQAVEVTKLSLLLKVLEGENEQTLSRQMQLFKARALPDLGRNIKCGNSLIGPEFYGQQELPTLENGDHYRINLFDWQAEFPGIMKKGGFDAVIGNPPYIRIQAMKEWAPLEVEFYKTRYRAASKGNYDIYAVFVEKGLSLLNPQGRLGFILPHKFFNARYGEPLRGLLSEGRHPEQVVHFGDQQVFKGSTTYTCLLFLSKAPVERLDLVKVADLEAWRLEGAGERGTIPARTIRAAEWNFVINGKRLFQKLSKMPVKLGEVADIFVGTQTSADDVYVLDDCQIKAKRVIGYSKSLQRKVKIELGITRPFLKGKEIRRYEQALASSRLICPYEIKAHSSRLFSLAEMEAKYPLALSYLKDNRQYLRQRENGRFKKPDWYAFGYPKSMSLFDRMKIIVPDYNNCPSFTVDADGHFFKTGYGVLVKSPSVSAYYLIGLLNSHLLFKHLLSIGTTLRGGYVRFWTQYLAQLPIRPIDFTDKKDKARHDKIVSLVETMLTLHKRQAAAKTDDETTRLERRIKTADAQIDALVYELYGLTEEEIRIVEGKG